MFGSGFQFEIANLYRGKTTEIDEVRWACTPTVNGILVHGSHITLYTRNGEITELDSSFDYRVLDADAEPSVTEETVCETALNAYFKNDDVRLYVEHIAEISGHTEKEVADVMRDSVAAKANLFFDSSDEHKLFWDVSVADIYDSEAREAAIGDIAEEDFDYTDIGFYGKYILSGLNYTYYVYANGDDAGKISISYKFYPGYNENEP